ncbi:MAG: glycoside hydrolase family 57 [Pseudomonadota bacterium]|nr:MAG: glycoside hydrolase family 57 [Pseudomonadota bacterium]
MQTALHATVLNLHQPPWNLEYLLEHEPWMAREILFALDRIPRALWPYEGLGKVNLSLSGTLLETLSSPEFQSRVYGIVKCGDLLWYLQNTSIVEILGTAYYHPVLPLIPEADRALQLERWRGIGEHLFWRRFRGFWPPELGFTEELIPLLRRFGYEFVIVDSEHVEPLEPMRWEELRYRPHVAEYGGESIVVVVRDRELSNAQESGMDPDWFLEEVSERTKWCDFPPLVTTCSDGDNGGWFRNTTPGRGFFGEFYQPLLERIRKGERRLRPTFLTEYLDAHGARGRVRVHSGAWNTGDHDGRGFVQWTGSERQKEALRRVHEVSALVRELASRDTMPRARLEEVTYRVLRAQTSCNFYWGEAWVDRCHRDLDEALSLV